MLRLWTYFFGDADGARLLTGIGNGAAIKKSVKYGY